MLSRHQLDTSLRYDRREVLPLSRKIEVANIDPIPERNPPTATISREPYLASGELEDAVNLAITLGRPLLLQGDPGAGKTRLAYAVAFSLGLPLEQAYVKSTSRAQDLLYTYDAVRRLYDAQLSPGYEDTKDRIHNIREYVRLGPLGRAIARATHGRRSVVLIDEIDKADIDFPNDLLRELDQLAFEIPEASGLTFAIPGDRPDLRPIIFVTNNEEKTLPDAFLRRCIFHYIKFPDDRRFLDEVLSMHEVGETELRAKAIDVLLRLRELELIKKPGLSELLDWVGYLNAVETPLEEIETLPHIGALLKQRSDQIRALDKVGAQS